MVNAYNALKDIKDYVSMGSEEEGNKLHPTYFIPQKEDMRALANQTNQILGAVSYTSALTQGVVKMLRANKAFDKLTAKEFKDY
jgi:hypothetical protein